MLNSQWDHNVCCSFLFSLLYEQWITVENKNSILIKISHSYLDSKSVFCFVLILFSRYVIHDWDNASFILNATCTNTNNTNNNNNNYLFLFHSFFTVFRWLHNEDSFLLFFSFIIIICIRSFWCLSFPCISSVSTIQPIEHYRLLSHGAQNDLMNHRWVCCIYSFEIEQF